MNKYKCKHGVLGPCEYCWAEGFKARRLNNPDYRKQVEALRESEVKRRKGMSKYKTELGKQLSELRQEAIDRGACLECGQVDEHHPECSQSERTEVDLTEYACLKVNKSFMPPGASLVYVYDDGEKLVLADDNYPEWVVVRREDLAEIIRITDRKIPLWDRLKVALEGEEKIPTPLNLKMPQ